MTLGSRTFARVAQTLALTGSLLAALPANAQTGPISNLIPNLFDRTIVLAATGHQAHFVDSSNVLLDAGLQLNSAIVSQLASFPVASSAGGFTFAFDPTLGVFTRTSESFGPIYAERAATIGKGKFNFGVSYSKNQYDAIDDLDLDEGDLAVSFTHLDVNGDGTTLGSVYEGDYILADARIDLETTTTVFSMNFGVTDRFDLAVAVPMVEVDLAASLETHVERLATEGFEDPPAHIFPDGSDAAVFASSGSSQGVGDILLRGKLRLIANEAAGLAMALDLRLPTGDEAELLGTGATQAKLQFIGSAAFGRFSPHFNAGYTYVISESDLVTDLPDEVNFTAGFDVALGPRVTLAADVLWRSLLDATALEERNLDHIYRRWDQTAISQTTRPVLETRTDDLNLVTAAIGLKVNLWGQMLLTANLISTLSSDGLQDEGVVPLLGIDYSF